MKSSSHKNSYDRGVKDGQNPHKKPPMVAMNAGWAAYFKGFQHGRQLSKVASISDTDWIR